MSTVAVCFATRAGVCPADETTFKYVRERTDADFQADYSDGDAGFFEELRHAACAAAAAGSQSSTHS